MPFAGIGALASRFAAGRQRAEEQKRADAMQGMQLFMSLLNADPSVRPQMQKAYGQFFPNIKIEGEFPETARDVAARKQLVSDEIDFFTKRYPGRPLPPALFKKAQAAGFPLQTKQVPVMEQTTAPDTEPRLSRPSAQQTIARPTGEVEEVEDTGRITLQIPGIPVPVEIDPNDPRSLQYFQFALNAQKREFDEMIAKERLNLAKFTALSTDEGRKATAAYQQAGLAWRKSYQTAQTAIAQGRLDLANKSFNEMARHRRVMEGIAAQNAQTYKSKGPATDPMFAQDYKLITGFNKYGDDPRQRAIVDAALTRMEKRLGITPPAADAAGPKQGPWLLARINNFLAAWKKWHTRTESGVAAPEAPPEIEEEEEDPLDDLYGP